MGRLGTRVVMPYVHRFKDRHGKLRYYYRRSGDRKPLRGDPGSPEFMSDYAAASAVFSPRAKISKGEDGTIARLVAEYTSSTQFKKLQPRTAANQRSIYNRFAEKHGKRLVAEMKRKHIDKMVAEMASTPGAANSFLSRLKTLMVYAVRNDWIETDPTYRLESFAGGEFHTWTEEEIAKFESFWAIETRQRLAFALHVFTGQRRSDVHRMTWEHLDDGGIWVTQQKKGRNQKEHTRLWLPIHEDLMPILDAHRGGSGVILKTEYGNGFTVAGYGHWISAAIGQAGLPDRCVPHGLRKAAARRLAESGCSSKQIASITGHKTLSEVERYTVAADQKKMAKAAMAIQKAASEGKPVVDQLANLIDNVIISDT